MTSLPHTAVKSYSIRVKCLFNVSENAAVIFPQIYEIHVGHTPTKSIYNEIAAIANNNDPTIQSIPDKRKPCFYRNYPEQFVQGTSPPDLWLSAFPSWSKLPYRPIGV